MNNFSNMTRREIPQKPQAASHMLWFFIVPAVAFMVWASWSLLQGLNQKPVQTTTVQEKLSKIRQANSAGARYQAAYSLAQELQKSSRSSHSTLSETDKDYLFSELRALMIEYPQDARLRRYLVLTLAQLKDTRSLDLFVDGISDEDPDVKFYAAWGLVETLSQNPSRISPDHIEIFKKWLTQPELSYKKIASSFLVRFPEHRPQVANLLQDENKEVQWNAAVALASQKDASGKSQIKEMLQLHTIRTVNFRSSQDLQQFVATALEAAQNLDDAELQKSALELKSKVPQDTKEGKAVHAAFGGFAVKETIK